jgi:hypothetical protein
LLDEPSVRIVQRIVTDLARMTEESRELRAALPHLNIADKSLSAGLATREMLVANIVSHQPAVRAGGA